MTTTTNPKYPNVKVQLTDEDGNALFIIARTSVALRRGGATKAEIDEFVAEAMSGDHNHLLQTVMQWVNVS